MPISTSEPHPFLLVLGMGYSATRFVELYGTRFARVAATARRADKLESLAARGVETFPFAGEASPDLREAAAAASHVLVSVPPGPEGDPVLAALGDVLKASGHLRWIGYLSTTGVYGDTGGAWIDETAPVRPGNTRSIWRAAAEQSWRDLAAPGRAVQLFRLSGIYGPGRNALVDLKEGNARRVTREGQVFNRIHVDDIAHVVAAGLELPEAGPVFNLADNEPAPAHEVVAYAAGLLGVEPPPLVAYDDARMSDMAKTFWSENKRVLARSLKEELGVDLRFPTYREGLTSLLAAGEGK